MIRHSEKGKAYQQCQCEWVCVYTCTWPKVEYRNTGISATVMAKACMMDMPSACLIDILAPPLLTSLHIQSLAPWFQSQPMTLPSNWPQISVDAGSALFLKSQGCSWLRISFSASQVHGFSFLLPRRQENRAEWLWLNKKISMLLQDFTQYNMHFNTQRKELAQRDLHWGSWIVFLHNSRW